MLETYERESVDHSLPNIGRMVTEDDYLQLRQQQQEPGEITVDNYIEQRLARQQHPQGRIDPAEPAPGQNYVIVEDAEADLEAAVAERPNHGRRCLIL